MSVKEPIQVGIRPWLEGDLPLLERLMGDPAMTEHLGGPESLEKIRARHARYCRSSDSGQDPMFVIVIGPEETAAGSIGYWEKEWQGQPVWETGWSVLPEFQGQGVARRATALVVERARAAGNHRYMHAFPSVDNGPSNSICRKAGFTLQGVVDFEYPPGHSMRCNDWRLDLLSDPQAVSGLRNNPMKKHYPWLLFDADGTLFDYKTAEKIAFENTFQTVHLPFQDEYLDTHRGINHRLWQALERGEIAPEVLRVRRFELLLDALQLAGSASEMSMAYTEHLSMRADLMDGAYDVVRTLHAACRLAIVTNGLRTVQRSRLAHSAIRDYISELIISEEVGVAKPAPGFFDAAFARLGSPAKSDVLLIGDSLSADIQGSLDYGLDTCWFNPAGEPRPDGLSITHEIAHLGELLDIIR